MTISQQSSIGDAIVRKGLLTAGTRRTSENSDLNRRGLRGIAPSSFSLMHQISHTVVQAPTTQENRILESNFFKRWGKIYVGVISCGCIRLERYQHITFVLDTGATFGGCS